MEYRPMWSNLNIQNGNIQRLIMMKQRGLTKRAPDKWESARFTGSFRASSFSLLPGRIHARPLAGNAHR